MIIWFPILALMICTIALAFSGIWRVKAKNNDASDHEQVLFHARIAEIDADFELGRIDEDAHEASKAEQARVLLKRAGTPGVKSGITRSTTFLIISSAMVFVPVFSLSVYFGLGMSSIANIAVDRSPQDTQASLEELVAAAERQLVKNPDDAAGWKVVAPVYIRTGQFEKAVNAFRNIVRLSVDDPDVERALAETLVLKNNNRVDDEALDLFRQLLVKNPADRRSEYFVALGEFQRGNQEGARKIWQSMRDAATGNEGWLPAVLAHLRELDGEPKPTLGFSQEQREQIDAMVAGLAERLEEEPEDKSGWERLVRSYIVIDKPDAAKQVLEKVSILFEDDPEFITRLESVIKEYASNGGSQ